MDIDYITFVEGENATDPEPIGGGTDAIQQTAQFNPFASNMFLVFDLKGKQVGSVKLDGAKVGDALRAAGYSQGVYMLRSVRGDKKFMVSVSR